MTKIELVLVPSPWMGHLPSMVELAKLIARTNPTISITILIYHLPFREPAKIQSYIESQSREVDPDQIEFITLPPPSNPYDPSHPAYTITTIRLQDPIVKKAIQDRQSKPAAIVLDLINASLLGIANELNVPAYFYYTSCVNNLLLKFHFQEFADEQGIPNVTGLMDNPDTKLDIPGFMNPVPINVLPKVFFDKEAAGRASAMLDLARVFRKAKGILVNSFTEFESSAIQALQNDDNIPTIYPIGPVLSLENPGDSEPSNNNDRNMSDEENIIISWLDEQPKSSVVFLCFGSMGSFDAKQVKEIAEGLDRSGHRFLWSLRKPVQVGNSNVGGEPSERMIFEDALPEGFMDRTAHKGKIIPWAPQITVLAHEAVGGFVSHCGWNSILESIWFGVPMATWPLHSEQQLNAFTLVKELGLAVEIKLDYRWDIQKAKANYVVKAEEVEDGVRRLMSLDEKISAKVREMKELSRKVLRTEDGSSRKALDRFIAEITENMG